MSPVSTTNSNFPSPPPSPSTVDIVDLRGKTRNSNTSANLRKSIIDHLSTATVPFEDSATKTTSLVRSIPTLVLYDDKGLEIFDAITYNDEYYLTNAEIDIFERHGEEIVRDYVKDGAVLVELGCGAMRKTKYILEAIERQKKGVTYYAVDLSETSLRESIVPLTTSFPSIHFVGLLGTYDDSLSWVAANIPASVPKTYLWLGSSIGNLTREEAAVFLRKVNDQAMRTGDTFICAIDRRNDPAKVGLAYNDTKGQTRDFILNGLDHVNTIFETPVLDRDAFEYVSIYNAVKGRHEAYYRSKKAQVVKGKGADWAFEVQLKEGEIINVEYSYKYSADEVDAIVEGARFYHAGKWTDSREQYDLHLFQKPPFFFDRTPVEELQAYPTVAEWNELWKAWDTVTMTMIAPTNYLEQPISLRHPYIFYVGHIPAFLDIQISRCIKEPFTPPTNYPVIFERGIDPDVDDPTQCHSHSDVPDEWPSLKEVVEYRDAVRRRVRSLVDKYEEGGMPKRLARTLHMVYEHEAMHLE
ncbi:hypothetical protein HK104_006529, partial [Borealophlyctis nickersoniae]